MRMHIEVAIMTKLTFFLQYFLLNFALLIHNDIDVCNACHFHCSISHFLLHVDFIFVAYCYLHNMVPFCLLFSFVIYFHFSLGFDR